MSSASEAARRRGTACRRAATQGLRVLACAALAAIAAVSAQEQENADAPRRLPAPMAAVGPVPGHDHRAPSTSNPLSGKDGVLRDGRKLFVAMNCSGCHGGRGGGGMGPSLRDAVWLYGDQDGQIFDSIVQGRANGMPAWGTQLPEAEVWKLVAYIRSLRTPQEPDAPPG